MLIMLYNVYISYLFIYLFLRMITATVNCDTMTVTVHRQTRCQFQLLVSDRLLALSSLYFRFYKFSMAYEDEKLGCICPLDSLPFNLLEQVDGNVQIICLIISRTTNTVHFIDIIVVITRQTRSCECHDVKRQPQVLDKGHPAVVERPLDFLDTN